MKALWMFVVNGVLTSVLTLSFGCQSSSKTTPNPEEPVSAEFVRMEKKYSELKSQDLDQMSSLMFEKLATYRKNDRLMALKEGVLTAFSRPNEDFIIEKILSPVRNQLEDNDEWEPTINQIVNQSMTILKEAKASGSDQVTAGVVLENILSEFKPTFVRQYKTGGFETTIVERIAHADVSYSKEAYQEMKLNLMRQPSSPSKIAQNMLAQKEEKLKK